MSIDIHYPSDSLHGRPPRRAGDGDRLERHVDDGAVLLRADACGSFQLALRDSSGKHWAWLADFLEAGLTALMK